MLFKIKDTWIVTLSLVLLMYLDSLWEANVLLTKKLFFSVWHWTAEHMWLRLCGSVWCGHREQCGNIQDTLLWRGKWEHHLSCLPKLLLLPLLKTWNDITFRTFLSYCCRELGGRDSSPAIFTYPTVAEVSRWDRNLFLNVSDEGVLL